MKWCIAVIVLVRLANVHAYDCSECLEEVATLKAEIKAVNQQYDQLRIQYDGLHEHVMKLTAMVADFSKTAVEGKSASSEKSSASAAKTSERILSTNQTGSATERRLSTTTAVVSSFQVHEFPDSCTNADGDDKLLLKMTSGAATFEPYPANPDSTVSLASLKGDWEINEVQSFEAPFKLVHSDCSTAPELHLPLNTNIPGTLTVGGTDVNAVNADIVWQAIPLRGGFSGVLAGREPYCGVKFGLVFLKGGVKKDGGAWAQTEAFGDLPTACIPTIPRIFIVGQHSGYWARIYIDDVGAFHHDISSHPATSSADNMYLDGCVFAKN